MALPGEGLIADADSLHTTRGSENKKIFLEESSLIN
jgi:hypothetical protein